MQILIYKIFPKGVKPVTIVRRWIEVSEELLRLSEGDQKKTKLYGAIQIDSNESITLGKTISLEEFKNMASREPSPWVRATVT
jgi:hypothetical protein